MSFKLLSSSATSLWEKIFVSNYNFIAYSQEHYVVLGLMFIIGILFIRHALKNWDRAERIKYGSWIAFALLVFQLSRVVILLAVNEFDITEDLPFHLCNFLPLLIYLAFRWDSKFMFSIIFYWIMLGTIQSNFTPTLENGFPNHDFFRYFAVHGGLTILALYGALGLGWSLKFSDAIRSALYANVLGAVIYPINLLTGGNYMYLMHKPPYPTLLDVLGPWPWYLFSIEMMMTIIFPIMTIPFILYYRKHDSVA